MQFQSSIQYVKDLLRKNAVVSLLGNGFSTLLGLLTFTLLARWLTKSVFGEWTLLLTTYMLFDAIRTGLVLNALIQQASHCDTKEEFRRWAGAAWQMGSGFTVLAAVVLAGGAGVVQLTSVSMMRAEFLVWIAVTGIVSLPMSVAGWLLHTRSQFFQLQWSKLFQPLVFLVLLFLLNYNNLLTIKTLCISYFLAVSVSSLGMMLAGWSSVRDFFAGTALERKPLLNYGKYSIGTLLGSNLLRSSDIYLIQAFLGSDAVALYSIPQRLIQLLDLPIRSIVVTSIPQMARLYRSAQPELLADYFRKSAGLLWVALLPISILGIVFADFLVVALGGNQYRDGAMILRLFMVYSALMPLDRYVGVLLDAIGLPHANLVKVSVMLLINVVGDLIALVYFQSVTAVAFVSIFTFGSGVILGFYMVGKRLPITWWQVMGESRKGIQLFYNKLSRS